MTRGRRALVLTALAVLLGGMAAADVTGRERALRDRLGPSVPVLVTRGPVAAGAALRPAVLAVRHVPARYAPADAYAAPAEVAGLRAEADLPAGADVTPALAGDGDGADDAAAGPPVRPGERVAELVARGSPALVTPGVRVDVLVTRETADGGGSTVLALEDAEVLAAEPAPEGDRAHDGPRVAVSLRASLRQAVYLAAAQDFARDVRVLPRAPGDRRRGATGMRVGSGL
jgi:pilus assembly protein CpaB